MPSPAFSADKLHPSKWLLVVQNWRTPRVDLSRLNATRWSLAGVIALTGCALALLGSKAIEVLRPPSAEASPMAPLDVPLVLERLRAKPLFEGTSQRPVLANKPSPRPPPWHLQGLFSGTSPTEGSAILSNGGQPAVLVRSGTLLGDGTRLLEVHHDRVVLQRSDGSKQSLHLKSPGPELAAERQAARTLALTPAKGVPGKALSDGDAVELAERRARIRQRLETLRQRARNSGGPS